MAVSMPEANGTMAHDPINAETPIDPVANRAISADEIALYDRQIRLWGVQAQERIRTAHILLISFKALANEVAKNLVLAGIGSLTIVDHQVLTEDDVCSQFFITEADIGKNRAESASRQLRKLNSRVVVNVDTSEISTKDPEYFAPFDIIIATDLDFNTFSMLNAATRLSNRCFYAAGAHGFYGYIFSDLISHDYVIEREKPNVKTAIGPESATRSNIATATKREGGKVVELVTKRELYSPLLLANSSPLAPNILSSRRRMNAVHPLVSCLRALWEFQKVNLGAFPTHSKEDLTAFTTLAMEKHKELQLPVENLKSEFLRSFLQNLGSELAPVTAFLGGALAQDVINVLGKRQQPIQNLLLFDGETSQGPVYALHPIFSDEAMAAVPPI